MEKSEPDALMAICRERARVAKAGVGILAARRKAEFEEQLATLFRFDSNETWRRMYESLQAATQSANEQLDRDFEAMGVPREFRGRISEPSWHGRGENAARERRLVLLC